MSNERQTMLKKNNLTMQILSQTTEVFFIRLFSIGDKPAPLDHITKDFIKLYREIRKNAPVRQHRHRCCFAELSVLCNPVHDKENTHSQVQTSETI